MEVDERTLQDSFRVVSLAKLDPKSLKPLSQAFRFAENEIQDQKGQQLTLMEVTPQVADQLERG